MGESARAKREGGAAATKDRHRPSNSSRVTASHLSSTASLPEGDELPACESALGVLSVCEVQSSAPGPNPHFGLGNPTRVLLLLPANVLKQRAR